MCYCDLIECFVAQLSTPSIQWEWWVPRVQLSPAYCQLQLCHSHLLCQQACLPSSIFIRVSAHRGDYCTPILHSAHTSIYCKRVSRADTACWSHGQALHHVHAVMARRSQITTDMSWMDQLIGTLDEKKVWPNIWHINNFFCPGSESMFGSKPWCLWVSHSFDGVF